MTEHQASRTLVKSPPELWAECSDARALSRHLSGSFGEIRITRLDPETTVAWEGERASGTVRLEPSGWGTRVVLTAREAGELVLEEAAAPPGEVATPPDAVPDAAAAPSPEAPDEVAPGPHPGFLRRVRRWFAGRSEPGSAAPASPAPDAAAPALDVGMELPEDASPPAATVASPAETGSALAAALDSLGQAHHRPFSRG